MMSTIQSLTFLQLLLPIAFDPPTPPLPMIEFVVCDRDNGDDPDDDEDVH